MLHTTPSGFFVFVLWEWVGRSAFWRQVNWLISQAKLNVSRTILLFSALQTPWPSGPQAYSSWGELLGLITVKDMGSWRRGTGSDCVKIEVHLEMLALYGICGLTCRKKENFLLL